MSGAPFRYVRAANAEDALQHASSGNGGGAIFLAGGTEFLQLWKSGIASPEQVVDISGLDLRDVTIAGSTLDIGALARLSDVAAHRQVTTHYPLLTAAILASASGQIRNMATVGGNLLQRTRCPYFRSSLPACNKRRTGTGCGMRAGENRHAALFGWNESCVAVHPSDLAVALAALDAQVTVRSSEGERRLSVVDLHPLPDANHAPDSVLGPGDLITSVRISDGDRFARCSTFLKVRDRASFEFAVLSVAAVLRIEDGHIAEARLAAGGVAPRPWRLDASEAALVGMTPTDTAFNVAGDLAIEGARPLAHNGFKVALLRNAVIRALTDIVRPRDSAARAEDVGPARVRGELS